MTERKGTRIYPKISRSLVPFGGKFLSSCRSDGFHPGAGDPPKRPVLIVFENIGQSKSLRAIPKKTKAIRAIRDRTAKIARSWLKEFELESSQAWPIGVHAEARHAFPPAHRLAAHRKRRPPQKAPRYAHAGGRDRPARRRVVRTEPWPANHRLPTTHASEGEESVADIGAVSAGV